MCRLKTFLLLQKNSEDVGKDTVLRGSTMNAMERVKTKQAAAELNIGVDSLQFLMQMEKMPIGYAKGIRTLFTEDCLISIKCSWPQELRG